LRVTIVCGAVAGGSSSSVVDVDGDTELEGDEDPGESVDEDSPRETGEPGSGGVMGLGPVVALVG
jgi:hypothetical protein